MRTAVRVHTRCNDRAGRVSRRSAILRRRVLNSCRSKLPSSPVRTRLTRLWAAASTKWQRRAQPEDDASVAAVLEQVSGFPGVHLDCTAVHTDAGLQLVRSKQAGEDRRQYAHVLTVPLHLCISAMHPHCWPLCECAPSPCHYFPPDLPCASQCKLHFMAAVRTHANSSLCMCVLPPLLPWPRVILSLRSFLGRSFLGPVRVCRHVTEC